MSKRVIYLGFLALAIMFSMFFAGSSFPIEKAEAEGDNIGQITVSGRGEIVIKPDVAYVQFGLTTIAKTAKEAHEQNAKQFAEINNALKALNIQDKDIKTIRFTTYPQYEWIQEKQQQELKGYQVEQIIQVAYRNMDGIGTLLDKVSQAGVNRVENIQYATEKWESYQIEALEKAMDNARTKADRLAKKAGVTIARVVSINENGINAPYYTGAPIYLDTQSFAKESMPSTQINPGEMKVEANVTVTYGY